MPKNLSLSVRSLAHWLTGERGVGRAFRVVGGGVSLRVILAACGQKPALKKSIQGEGGGRNRPSIRWNWKRISSIPSPLTPTPTRNVSILTVGWLETAQLERDFAAV